MMRSVLAIVGAMGMAGLVAGQQCRSGEWFDGRTCQTCLVCRPGQTVMEACAATSNTVCGTSTEQTTASNGEPCTPWANGAIRCADGLVCVATWNNEGEGSHNPAVCYPSDTVFPTSVHDPPRCQQNDECASTFWCNTNAQPPSCESILRTDPPGGEGTGDNPQTCMTANDCPTDAGEGCGYDCIQGQCAMWVRRLQPCPQWRRVYTPAVISTLASTHHCRVAIAVAAPAGSVPMNTKLPGATHRAAISPL